MDISKPDEFSDAVDLYVLIDVFFYFFRSQISRLNDLRRPTRLVLHLSRQEAHAPEPKKRFIDARPFSSYDDDDVDPDFQVPERAVLAPPPRCRTRHQRRSRRDQQQVEVIRRRLPLRKRPVFVEDNLSVFDRAQIYRGLKVPPKSTRFEDSDHEHQFDIKRRILRSIIHAERVSLPLPIYLGISSV